MATGDVIDVIRPRDLTPQNGPVGTPAPLVKVNEIAGVPLAKLDTQVYAFEMQVPTNGTPLSTGLTFLVGIVDADTDGDPGKVVRLGITVKKLVSGTDDETSDNSGTEQGFDATTDATSGQLVVVSCAIASANLDSAAASSRLLVMIRRISTHANDTHQGRAVLTSIVIKDT